MTDATPAVFSRSERDRRWRETRQRMTAAGIDALAMLPAGPGDRFLANQRYLSQIGAHDYPVGMTFSADGEPTVATPESDAVDRGQTSSWVGDIRSSDGGTFGAVLARRLVEQGMDGATIGIPYLDAGPDGGESPLPAGSLSALRSALPRAKLVDATRLLREQRAIKSDEEIAAIERAVAIAETGIFSLGYQVRAGMLHTEGFSILQGAVLKAGGEPGSRVLWACSPRPGRPRWQAEPVPMQWGDVIQNELESRFAGYGVEEVHPICVGKPPRQIYETFDLCIKTFDELLPLVVPGTTLRDLAERADAMAEGSGYRASVVCRGCGVAPEPLGEANSLRERQALTFGPALLADDGTRISFRTTVLVTPEGGRRLSKRPMELMLTSRSFLSAYTEWRPPEPTAPWLSSPSLLAGEGRGGGDATLPGR